ncbi:thioesterase family protein [Nonomuraea aridisoli]|uniref:Thioesterase family protein n=1 Tax=Nonomuraea aridisoli TaxID=2070368 RepID=A0A2W2ES46_9ACTN|nr:thioesterase family protein [Nonomuraea aridisoli]PZG19609.1 thioesterase family protein [Nonomuraea aridisoli]
MGTFQEATALTTRGDGAFGVTLDADWSIGTRLHGGYLLAVLAGAARESAGADHPHVTAVTGSFIGPPEPGEAVVRVETLRIGRSVTQTRASLTQEGRTCVEAHVTLGVLDDSGPWWSAHEPVDIPPEQECFRVPVEPPGLGVRVPLMGVLEEHVHPGHLGFAFGEPAGNGVIASWQRLGDGSDWDPVSLLVTLDPGPPIASELGLTGWFLTISLSAYLRRLPAPGPVRVRLSATDVGGERMDQSVSVWDANDHLVGQATHLTGVRLPAGR